MLCNFLLYDNNIQKSYSVSRCVFSIIIVFAPTPTINMCYITTGLSLNFCFPLLKWADSCYSKRDDIWRPGTKFCRTYDCYWTNIKLLSLSLCARAWACMCICICVIAHPHLSFLGYANDGSCLHSTHDAGWKVPPIISPCLKICLCGLETWS